MEFFLFELDLMWVSQSQNQQKRYEQQSNQILKNEIICLYFLILIRDVLFKLRTPNSIYNIKLINSQPMQSSKSTHLKKPQQTTRKAKYDVIGFEKRKELISLVLDDQVSIYRASRLTGINNATAKVIIRKYREEGTIFIRKSQKWRFGQEKSDISQQQYSIHDFEKSEQEQAPIISFQNNLQPISPQDYFCQATPYYIYPTFYMYTPTFF